MKILFVCQQYIHAARWISQLKDTEHEVFVFDCLDKPIHEELKWTNYITNWSKRKLPKIKGEYFLEKRLPTLFEKIEPFLKITPANKLIDVIKEIKPDLVHSLEMQSQTYPILKARKKINFKWAYFSWGSDLYLYQNDKSHQKKIKKVFSKLNYLFTDNTRDINLANNFNFKGEAMPVFPGGGGYHIEEYRKHIKPISKRNLILIKGYHHWAGRALYVLKALEKIVDTIKEYEIYVYSAHDIVIEKIEEIKIKYGLKINYSSRKNEITHKELLEKFGSAKIAIGNSISDGVPNTLLEAIILGAFPIQSNPGGASEDYVKNGVNGYLIENPESTKEIATLIEESLSNKLLLQSAFKKNEEFLKKLEYNYVQEKVAAVYKKIEGDL